MRKFIEFLLEMKMLIRTLNDITINQLEEGIFQALLGDDLHIVER